ncbi:MAG: polysaccharide deacetylase family protein [Vicinamibacteria bacterium]
MTGLPRVLDLLKRQAIPASFYIPAVSAMLHPKMIEMIREPGVHEIGVHGSTRTFRRSTTPRRKSGS